MSENLINNGSQTSSSSTVVPVPGDLADASVKPPENRKTRTGASAVSRRAFLSAGGAASAAILLGRRGATAQELPAILVKGRAAGATAKITHQALRRNVSVLMGSGSNIGVLSGAQGKLLVDTGFSTAKPHILDALAAQGDGPIQHLINTHWHFDHTDGNEWIHAGGATIVAHENTRSRLSTPQEIAAFQTKFPAAPNGAVPADVFATEKTISVNGESIELRHYDPAHTDTDISVHFTEANILHVGDTWFNGRYPFIDYSTGGNINGMIAAAERNLKFADGDTLIVPGHGPVGDKTQLTAFYEMLVSTRDRVAQLKRQGRSLDEIIAAKPTAAYDEKWGKDLIQPSVFTTLIYAGV